MRKLKLSDVALSQSYQKISPLIQGQTVSFETEVYPHFHLSSKAKKYILK